MFIACYDNENIYGIGDTLDEAHTNLCDIMDEISLPCITFYEAKEIEVSLVQKSSLIKKK